MPQVASFVDGKRYTRIVPVDTLNVRYPDKLIYVHLANCLGLSILDTLHVIAHAQLDALGRPDYLPRPVPLTPRRKSSQRNRSPVVLRKNSS